MATARKTGAGRQAPADPRRRRARVRAPGFHHCRVSDVADEAGVAYGLVYHYFDSKEEILNTLFLERWQIMLDAIAEIDGRDEPAREKLYEVASFIVDSYRYDPDLMKVIIVEVTRAANSFGRVHLDKIREAYEGIAAIVETRPRGGLLPGRRSRPSSPRCASTARSSSCSRAGSSRSCRAPTRSTRTRRGSSSTPSAGASRRRPPPGLG